MLRLLVLVVAPALFWLCRLLLWGPPGLLAPVVLVPPATLVPGAVPVAAVMPASLALLLLPGILPLRLPVRGTLGLLCRRGAGCRGL